MDPPMEIAALEGQDSIYSFPKDSPNKFTKTTEVHSFKRELLATALASFLEPFQLRGSENAGATRYPDPETNSEFTPEN